jgi:hypothetical protein
VATEDGDDRTAARCAEAEAAFLAEHLGRFGPTFLRELADCTAAPVYGLLAAIGERAIVFEIALRDIVPQRLPLRQPLAPSGVEDDEIECG